MKNLRNGFTIVELLVVVAIISILAGAITMGVNGMFYKSRLGRAKAMQAMLQSGLETFYARTGEWPSVIQSIINSNPEGDTVLLTADQADRCFREIVRMSVGPNARPVLDPSGLFVAKDVDDYGCTDIHRAWKKAEELGIVSKSTHRCNASKCKRGIDFSEAIKKKTSSHMRTHIKLADMNFGYQGPNHGKFCRFRVYYYPKADTVKVNLQPATQYNTVNYRNGFTDD